MTCRSIKVSDFLFITKGKVLLSWAETREVVMVEGYMRRVKGIGEWDILSPGAQGLDQYDTVAS